MNSRSAPIESVHHVVNALVALGLVDDDDGDHSTIPLAKRLGNLATIWPVAIVGHLIAFIMVTTVAAITNAPLPMPHLVLAGGALLILSIGMLALLGLRVLRNVTPVPRNRAVVATVTPIGASLMALTMDAAALPAGPWQLATLVACLAAIALTGYCVHPVRAGTMGFHLGLIAMFAVSSGAIIAILVGIGFITATAIASIRLARMDYRNTLDHAIEARDGRLAAKMIAEFETPRYRLVLGSRSSGPDHLSVGKGRRRTRPAGPGPDRRDPDRRLSHGQRHPRHRTDAGVPFVVAHVVFGLFGLRDRRRHRCALVVDFGAARRRRFRPVPGVHRVGHRPHLDAPIGGGDHAAGPVRQPHRAREPPTDADQPGKDARSNRSAAIVPRRCS